MGLFHDVIDRNRSYLPVVASVDATIRTAGIAPNDCVSLEGVPPGIRAIFSYGSDLSFTAREDQVCRYRVLRLRDHLTDTSDVVGEPASRTNTTEHFVVVRSE